MSKGKGDHVEPKFREQHSFAKRAEVARKIMVKYPTRIPVVVERAADASDDIPDLPKKKFLVPADISVGRFIWEIRRQLLLRPASALFVFIGNVIPPTETTIGTVYSQYGDADGFLYITYSGENTFGMDARG